MQPTVITVGENCPQNRTVITVCVRFDCMKYSGEHEAGDDSDDDGDNRVTYSLGIAMLVFRIHSPALGTGKGEGFRDFCFVRQMKGSGRPQEGRRLSQARVRAQSSL